MVQRLKNKKTISVLLIFVLITVFFGVRKIITSKDKASTQNQTLISTVQRGNLKSTVEVSGKIETANYLTVTTSVNGIVKKVFVKEGDTVTKGQKIMEITLNSEGEESLAQAWSQYLSVKISLETAKKNLLTQESALIKANENFEEEKENNSYQTHDEQISYKLAENDYITAKMSYENQQEVIKQAQISLNKAWLTYLAQSSNIVAPDAGIIANIVAVEGMNITNSLAERTSTAIASIRKEGEPIASLNVSEVDINNIKVGQKVELTLNSVENKIFGGSVVGIDKIGTSSNGVSNYPVIVKFDEKSDLVLPNMGIEAEIIIEENENVLYVPTPALTSMKGKTMVRVNENGKETLKPVETGIKTTDYTEIISGLNEGDQILINILPTQGFTSDDKFRQGGGVFPGLIRR